MSTRKTAPETTNKYYVLAKYGGYALGIAGSDGGKMVIPNCAGYSACRFNEYNHTNAMKYYAYWRNAEYFFEDGKKQGLFTGTTPKIGAIMCWEGIGTAAGHVAFVEDVYSDGSILTSESAWMGNKFYNSHRYKETGNWGMNTKSYKFIGFIYSPVVDYKQLKKGDKGAEVELMQLRLYEKGYLRKNEIDGDFGTITLGAVCAFQLENGLDVDGICGVNTWGKLA